MAKGSTTSQVKGLFIPVMIICVVVIAATRIIKPVRKQLYEADGFVEKTAAGM